MLSPAGAGSAQAQRIVSAGEGRFSHEAWTAANGLPVNQLSSLIQAQDGYLWATTFDGLVRFDGVRFTVFNRSNTEALPTNRLSGIWEDGAGRLWIRTQQHQLFELRQGRFIDHTHALGEGPLTTLRVDALDTWVGTGAGLFKWQDSTFVSVHPGHIVGSVQSLLVDTAQRLWVGMADGELYRLSDRGQGLPVRVARLAGSPIALLAEDPQGRLWVGNHLRAFRIDEAGPTALPPYPPEIRAPQALHFPDDGPVWVQTWGGRWALLDGVWTNLADRPDLNLGITGPDGATWAYEPYRLLRNGIPLLTTEGRIERLLFDREGTLWVSGDGLHKLRPTVLEQRGDAEGLVSNVYSLYEDRRGRVWFGTIGRGLARLDANGLYRYPTDAASGLSVTSVSVVEDRHGQLWAGRYQGGLCQLQENGCRAGTIEPLGGRRVTGLHEDESGRLWVGTVDGVARRETDGTWRHFSDLPHPEVRNFAEGPGGTLWMATLGGVVRWQEDTFAVLGPEEGLSSPVIRALYTDADGILWVGTEGRGLNRVVLPPRSSERVAAPGRVAAEVTVYRQADGLYDEGIHAIVEDDFGRLWMSTNRGLFWVAKQELTDFAEGRLARIHATFYTERDGLLSREFNGGVNNGGLKDRNGHLWFGGQAGVVRIDPASLQRTEGPPAVVIEEVTTAGAVHTAAQTRIELAAHERSFDVAYTAMSFVAPENVRFRYRLEGLQADWIDAGARRRAFYTNVPPGTYHFRVAAAHPSGGWSREAGLLTVVVAPFFYETWPARIGAGLLLALLALGGWRYRERHHRRRAAHLEARVQERTQTIEQQATLLRELDEAKSRFFANVSHELRTPLTLTIGPLEDVSAGLHGPIPNPVADDVALALNNARHLLRLVNQILDVARLESGQLKLRAMKGDLQARVEGLVAAFAALAERRDLSLRFRGAGAPADLYFDPDLIEKVFANLLSNALKFTPAGGTVRVCVETAEDGSARVTVRDSGPGIAAEDLPHLFERFHRGRQARHVPGTGIGLSLAHELVNLHGGRIEVESEEGFGATFTVTLPTGRAHLPEDAVVPGETPRPPSGHDAAPVWTGPEVARPETAPPTADPAANDPDAADHPLVLVVDDNAKVRMFLARHLAPRFRIVEAGDGAEALTIAMQELPDLIISDVVMPGTDGLDLLRALRADPEVAFIPVILLSARADVADRIRGLQVGADDYLTKPFKAAELVARVDNLIRSRQRLRGHRPPVSVRASRVEAASAEDRLLDAVREAIEAGMADENFDVEALATTVGKSRSALYRSFTDLGIGSPADLIRSLRLDRAAQLLAAHTGTVSEVAYAVGFKSVSHFSRSFRDRFGVTPSAYREHGDQH